MQGWERDLERSRKRVLQTGAEEYSNVPPQLCERYAARAIHFNSWIQPTSRPVVSLWRSRRQRDQWYPARRFLLVVGIVRVHPQQSFPHRLALVAFQLRRHHRLRPSRCRPDPAVRLGLEVLPPFGMLRVPAIGSHHNHSRPILQIQQQHRTLAPRLPSHRPKPKRRRPLQPPTHQRKDRLLKPGQSPNQSWSHGQMLAVSDPTT